jgi:hypothetical protein
MTGTWDRDLATDLDVVAAWNASAVMKKCFPSGWIGCPIKTLPLGQLDHPSMSHDYEVAPSVGPPTPERASAKGTP